jgi:hypothetical protein
VKIENLRTENDALKWQLKVKTESEPPKTKSHEKWVAFTDRHKRKAGDADAQSTPDNKKNKLDFSESEEEALDDSAEHQLEGP